jgi:molybdopterin/thiamine biosynthesis adenylyltransferase
MDLRKHYEFFNPHEAPPIHLVGVGAVGSTLASMIARLGLTEIHLWDFDTVEMKNIANQNFVFADVGELKTKAVKDNIEAINPACKVHLHGKYTGQLLAGIVFTTSDSVVVRKNIIKSNRYNPKVLAYIDVRMRLTDGQIYFATFKENSSIQRLLDSLNFTDEEADKATPKSACGTTLNVRPTVTSLCSIATAQLINYLNTDMMENYLIMHSVFENSITAIDFQ